MRRLFIHTVMAQVFTRYMFCIVILSVMVGGILGCKTTDAPFREKEYQDTLPAWPYVSGFDTYAYIRDKRLMALATKNYGLGVSLLVNKIQRVYVNQKSDTFVFVIEFGVLSFHQKVSLLRRSGATPVDARDQYWHIHTEQEDIFINTEYDRTLVVSNIDIDMFVSLPFTWIPPKVVQDVEHIYDSALWFWSKDNDFVDIFAFDKAFNPEWTFVRLSDYNQDELILAFVAMPYHGSLEARATFKLLFPFYLKNFMSMEISSLPEVIFTRDTLLIHGLVVSRNFLETLMDKAIQL